MKINKRYGWPTGQMPHDYATSKNVDLAHVQPRKYRGLRSNHATTTIGLMFAFHDSLSRYKHVSIPNGDVNVNILHKVL